MILILELFSAEPLEERFGGEIKKRSEFDLFLRLRDEARLAEILLHPMAEGDCIRTAITRLCRDAAHSLSRDS